MALTDHAHPPSSSRAAPAVGRRAAGTAVAAPTVRRPAASEWDELASGDPIATPSLGRAWVELVTRTSGLTDLSTLSTFPDGRRVLLPLVGRRWPTGGIATAGSMPAGWGFGGVLVDGKPSDAHLDHIWRGLTSQPAVRIRLRPNPLEAAAWARTAPPRVGRLARRAHVLDLRGGFDSVWGRQADADARSNVRRALRLGVEITSGSDERHRRAYRELLARSRVRWAEHHREPARLARWRAERSDPWERIEAMIGGTDVCRLWIAWHAGAPAAAIVVAFGRNAHYTRGVMDRDLAATTRANDLLQHTAIEHACALGCDWYHIGENGSSRPLARFKERFGARPHEYEEYLVERVPIHAAEHWSRERVKRAIGYRDA